MSVGVLCESEIAQMHTGLNDPILQASEILTPKQACVTNLKRFKADPAPSLGIPCITRWSAAPYMTTWPRVRARRCQRGGVTCISIDGAVIPMCMMYGLYETVWAV